MPPHLHRRSTYHMYNPETLPSYHESQAAEHDGKGKKKSIEGDIDYAEWKADGKGLSSAARVARDGRINVSLKLKRKLPDLPEDYAPVVDEFAVDKGRWFDCPPLSIVIMIVGSRGDVQPYVALGKRLKQDGHRIRIASHENFRSFVNDNGLEFYGIGGDPHELMSYMVKNPGLVPGMESLTNGDIPKKRKMLQGCWDSCSSPDETTGAPFMADAIISNPPAFAHIHCAEALGIPLLLSFTMPWCATGAFPHPLVNVKFSNAGERLTNHMSYAVADILTWQGMGDIINKFRNRALGLPSLSVRSGPGLADRLKVPWTYCMSPALVPKPKDWSNHIDVVGFYFLDLATSFTPPDDLAAFLGAGEPPVYIGFGSVVVDDPEEMSRIIFEATAKAGVRAIVSAGWGGLGGLEVPPHIYIVGNVPHDWLFAQGRVSAVVHHGGAGTTAIGLSKGRPTVIVPFFGDQEFWGDMIHRAGAGPAPIPHRKLTVENLADALVYATSPPAQEAASKMAEQITTEDGVAAGTESFYRHLPLLNMRCDVCPDKVAVWWSTDQCLKLSALAAQTLIEARELKLEHLDLHRTKEYESRKKFRDPLTAGPLAGMLGFVSLPLQGAWRSIESPRSQQQERQQRRLRVEEGEEAVRHLSVSERQEIVYRYYVLKRDTHVRRQRLAALAEAKLKEDMQEGAMEDAVFADRTSATTPGSPGTSQASSCRSSISSSGTTTAPTSTRPSLMRSSASEPAVRHSESESELERRYQEDLNHAIRLSMSISRPSETRSNTR
ncbi:hypothetical protein EV715DRAFT_245583 [Schizophyllum commune]